MLRFAYVLTCLALSVAGAVVNGFMLFVSDGPMYGLINWWWGPFIMCVGLVYFWANALRWDR